MIRAVYDTNILVSAFIGRGAPKKALDAVFDGRVRLILSPAILDEFKDVISRRKFGFTRPQIEKMPSVILLASELIEPQDKVDVVKEDPKDNMILECAKAGNVKYVVSGDSHLLKLKKWNNIEIITAKNFLDILKNEK